MNANANILRLYKCEFVPGGDRFSKIILRFDSAGRRDVDEVVREELLESRHVARREGVKPFQVHCNHVVFCFLRCEYGEQRNNHRCCSHASKRIASNRPGQRSGTDDESDCDRY
ncbi:MAG TPA: hypothetical protein VI258_07255, partial [Rhodanobacteraceae bacterium]